MLKYGPDYKPKGDEDDALFRSSFYISEIEVAAKWGRHCHLNVETELQVGTKRQLGTGMKTAIKLLFGREAWKLRTNKINLLYQIEKSQVREDQTPISRLKPRVTSIGNSTLKGPGKFVRIVLFN